MTPKDYPELVRLMARAHWNSANAALPWNKVDKQIQIYRCRNMHAALAAMQAVGVVPVHEEATEEMVIAALDTHWPHTDTELYICRQINAAIAAAPYRRKE